jgi:hypothetical protein
MADKYWLIEIESDSALDEGGLVRSFGPFASRIEADAFGDKWQIGLSPRDGGHISSYIIGDDFIADYTPESYVEEMRTYE